MKKTIITTILLTAITITIGGCTLSPISQKINQTPPENSIQGETEPIDTKEIINEEKTDEEKFNESGRAKAIEKDSDLWQVYDNPEVGFSFKYPHTITLLEEGEYNKNLKQSYIKLEIKNIGEKEGPLDFDLDEAMKNIEALSGGEFGINHDFPLVSSKKARTVSFLFAQDFIVLSRFEVCSVILERKLLFYFNNKQILITLHGPVETLRETMPEYFTVNETNCGEEKIWDFDKQDKFYKSLVDGNGSKEIQSWFDSFDEVSETIIFAHR